MSFVGIRVDTSVAALTSSTISMSETVWPYNVAAALNSIYFDPVTRKIYKARTAGISTTSLTFDSVNDKVNWTAHGRANGDILALAVSGGTVPTGLTVSTPYYLINADTNTFQIALTPDGDPINFTTSGTGTITGYINGAFDNTAAWQKRGSNNRWNMHDASNRSVTTFSGSCQVVVAPTSRIDAIAALAMTNVSELYIASAGTNASRTNQLLQSCTFDDAAWTKTNAAVTANAVRAPDGTMTADKLVGSATNGVHTISQTCTGLLKSIYVRAGELTKGTFATAGGSGWFDLGDGTITLNSGTGSFFIERVNNSLWWRIWTPTPASGFTIGLRNAAGADSFAGSASQGFYIWGAQSEAVTADSRPTGPIVTTGSTVTTSTDTYIAVYNLTDTSLARTRDATYPVTRYRRDFGTIKIPPWASQSITVTLVSPGTGSIGNLGFCLTEYIGDAEYESDVGTQRFSDSNVDEFGDYNPVIRASAKTGGFQLVLPETMADAIKAAFDALDINPAYWFMAPDDEAATGFEWKQRGLLFGMAKNVPFKFWKPSHDRASLELEAYT